MISYAKKFSYHFFEAVRDVLTILQGIWFLLLFNALAFYAFIIASQGSDVLLAIAEDLGNLDLVSKGQWGTTIFFLIATILWCIASEFCCRFLIYLSDNSGRALAPKKVTARKRMQWIIGKCALFYPLVLMLIAFIKALIINYNELYRAPQIKGVVFIILILGLCTYLLTRFYFGKKKLLHKIASHKKLKWLFITPNEKYWAHKLFGILNPVRIELSGIDDYDGIDLKESIYKYRIKFPNLEYLKPYKENPYKEDDTKIWMYFIDRKFYSHLFTQLLVLFGIAVFIILLIGIFLPSYSYLNIGSAALICFAFAAWQIVYVFLAFLDKLQKVPVRLILLVWLCIVTFINKDHPIDVAEKITDNRPTLNEHFDKWLTNLKNDTSDINGYYRIKTLEAIDFNNETDSIPVIFVAAEGGALRTGAFTALLLSNLQDSLKVFSKYIYCYSSVSGGSVGANYFNSLNIANQSKPLDSTFAAETRHFFKQDFLAAVTGKLVFSEIINYFIPYPVKRFDRAIALEKAWENEWLDEKRSINYFTASFNNTIGLDKPAIFINTTEAESGIQSVYSNVKLDGLPYYQRRDLYNRFGKDMSYSTAINLSSRFPLISPGGAFIYRDDSSFIKFKIKDTPYVRHYVDGGFYENKGAETLLQVLQALKLKNKKVKVYVLQFDFEKHTQAKTQGLKAANEITEPLNALLNTRSARAEITQHYLKQHLDSINGVLIDLELSLTTKEFPMNWVMSNTAITRLDSVIKKFMQSSGGSANAENPLQNLFFYNPAYKKENK